jgi:hypothetical protein
MSVKEVVNKGLAKPKQQDGVIRSALIGQKPLSWINNMIGGPKVLLQHHVPH